MNALLRTQLETTARTAGWNLMGAVDVAHFDGGQPVEGRCGKALPNCGTAIVFATGGREQWRRGRKTTDVTAELRQHVKASGLLGRVLPAAGGGQRLNLNRLAEAAGIGVVSPVLGVLLHPEFGPWVGVRAAVLLPGHPLGPVSDCRIGDAFQPCAHCPRPCLSACPVPGHDAMSDPGTDGCLEHWQAGSCALGCLARAACPVGSDQRCDERGEKVRHAEAMRGLLLRHGRGPVSVLRRFLGR